MGSKRALKKQCFGGSRDRLADLLGTTTEAECPSGSSTALVAVEKESSSARAWDFLSDTQGPHEPSGTSVGRRANFQSALGKSCWQPKHLERFLSESKARRGRAPACVY